METSELIKKLNEADEAYYTSGVSPLTDIEYDALERYILYSRNIPEDQKVIIRNRVGYSVKPHTNPRMKKHHFKMLGVEKTYYVSEVMKWANKIYDKNPNVLFRVEPKYDGVACALVFLDGVLQRALTRGDGNYGLDITDKVKEYCELKDRYFTDNPEDSKGLVVVTGELIINTTETIELEYILGKPVDNLRNIVAGFLNRVETITDYMRKPHITFIPYNAQTNDGRVIYPAEFMSDYGSYFYWVDGNNLFPYHDDPRTLTISELENAIKEMMISKSKLSVETDGIVIKVVNDNTVKGKAKKYPGVIALKNRPLIEVTKVIEIIHQTGKTGKVTPVAIVEPITIKGKKINRVNLYNDDNVKTLDIRAGDLVEVSFLADCIPAINKVLDQFRLAKQK